MQAGRQAGRWAGGQAGGQAGRLTGGRAGGQVGRRAGRRAGGQAGGQAGRQAPYVCYCVPDFTPLHSPPPLAPPPPPLTWWRLRCLGCHRYRGFMTLQASKHGPATKARCFTGLFTKLTTGMTWILTGPR